MITFYKADETDFDNNGLGVLDHDIQNPDIEEKLNDIFTFSFNYPIFGVNGARLAARMIVKADDPENEGQLFRIMKLSKSNGMLTAFCYHIFYDLNGNEIPDTNIVGQNGQTAITQMLSKTAVGHKFQGFSDISDIANIRVVRMSPVKFLLDTQTDNNFINRLGGEIRRVNYRIWMNKVRGSDNGATIRWKKSLDSYNATWDYTTVATRIRPVGYNGIMLPENYVDSPLINSYETIVIKEIQYSDIKAIDPDATSNDETAVPLEQAYELLRQAAAKEFSENNLDKPTVTLTVNMVALRNMDEYKDVQSLETINPWDTVTVINERDGLSVKVRLNHYHWNPVTRKFISMELGNSKSTFTDIGSKVDHATNLANQANDTANTAAESANGKNSNYYGPSEPIRPVDGDLWYKKNGDKTELWQYDGKSVPPGWKLVVDDATGEEVRQNVDAAQKEAEEAKNQANKAVDGANDAVAKAGFANETATQAKNDAADALTNAKKALTDSGSAMADSAQAIKDSATAKIQAANAATQANQAVTDAHSAKADANTAKANATQAINDAAAAKGQATNALGQANTAIGNALTALNKVNNMQIGGRNLVSGTNLEYAMYYGIPNTTWKDGYAFATLPLVSGFDAGEILPQWPHEFYYTINQGTTYTQTIWFETDATVKDLSATQITWFTNGVGHDYQPAIVQKIGQNSYKVVSTYAWPGKSDNSVRLFDIFSLGSAFDLNTGTYLKFGKLKLEEGNVATDWSPALEDVQIQIDNVNGELSQKVSQTTYNTLAGTVDTVSTLSKQNQSTIGTLATKTSVDTVNRTATTAQTLAQQNANELLNKASTNTVDTLTQRVTTAESTLSQTATKAELALTKTDVDKLNDTVKSQGVTLDATATKAELQVAQTNVDNLKKTVTSNTAGMTANANALKLKADSSTVSSLDGRVTNLSGQLDVQADKIAATVTASDVTGMLNGYATQTWTQNQIKMTADGINGTMSSIKSTVDGQTTSINDLKADSSSFKSQFTTVNNTLGKHTTDIGTLQASSKELTTGFNTLTTDNGTNKNDISQLKQTATEVSSTLETVQTQVQNSAVGTNLIQMSNTTAGYVNGLNGTINPADDTLERVTDFIEVEPNKAYCMQEEIYLRTGQYLWFGIGVYDGNKNFINRIAGGGSSVTSDDTAFQKWTIVIPENAKYVRVSFVTYGDDSGRFKFEKGSVATDFSVNPLDTATVTALSNLSQTVNGIQFDISKKIEQKDLNGYATETWTKGQLDLTDSSLTSQISSVEDGLTKQYTQLQQTLDGVQVTANNAVTQGQLTLLSNQFTSTISGIQVGGTNLLKGTAKFEFPVNANGGTQTVQKYDDETNYIQHTANTPTDSMGPWWALTPDLGQVYTLSADVCGNGYIQGDHFHYEGGDAGSLGRVDLTNNWQRISNTFRVNTIGGNNWIIYADSSTLLKIKHIKIEKGNQATDWSPAPEDQATVADVSSQFTQLQNDINLRVKTGDVVNQINISPEGILIDGKKVHITGQTTIDNAVIKDAMIADIKADKITAGTLNAANVNVINLNANNITTGTIKGANLSLNLNTGEVLFQKGSIKSTNGNLNIDIDDGSMAVLDGQDGFYFKNGKLSLSSDWAGNEMFGESNFGSIEYSHSLFGSSGMLVSGNGGLILGTNKYKENVFVSKVVESGISITPKGVSLQSDGTASILAGTKTTDFPIYSPPFILVGTDGDGTGVGNRIQIYAEYVHIPSAYRHTDSGSANVVVAADGALVRSTSASKYKTDIIRTNIPDYGDKLLNLPTATWTDIAETKRYQENPTTQPKPTRNFGMIAEDLADAGLEMLVVRGTDGELEGINYDRIGPALIPVIAKLKNEVETLKQQLEVKTA